jgi:hypothetical protein
LSKLASNHKPALRLASPILFHGKALQAWLLGRILAPGPGTCDELSSNTALSLFA